MVAAASSSDLVLVLKSCRPGYLRSSTQLHGFEFWSLAGTLECAAYDKMGRPLWEYRLTVRSTDDVDAVLSTDRQSAWVSPPHAGCAAAAAGETCSAAFPTPQADELAHRAAELLASELKARLPLAAEDYSLPPTPPSSALSR